VAGETYSGEALRDALKAGTFNKPHGSVELVGMVKESDDELSIAFTPRGCETWVDVPISMIDSAEHVGHRRCDDHSHPIFRITLKEADGDEAKVLSALLAAIPQPRPEEQAWPPARRPGPRGVPSRGGGFMARRRSPFGGLGGRFGETKVDCEQICEEVYAFCFRTTESMPNDDWRDLCYLEYALCMAGCEIVT
jgi:hypothetical protein